MEIEQETTEVIVPVVQESAASLEVKQDDKIIGALCHALGMIVIPLLVYLLKKDDSPFLAAHAKQALIWQGAITIGLTALSMFISFAAAFTFGLGGLLFLALPPLGLVAFCFGIHAAVKCWKGENYEYPLISSLVKSI